LRIHDKTKYQNMRGILRCYHLIPQSNKVNWSTMDDVQQSNHVRNYNRAWYRKNRAAKSDGRTSI